MLQVRQQSTECIVGKKRKTVQFEEPSYECEYVEKEECVTSSTHDYLKNNMEGRIDGKTWAGLAQTFNCCEPSAFGQSDDNNLMSELLDLCSWWNKQEDNYGMDEEDYSVEDSDSDDEGMDNFKSYISKFQPASSTSSDQCDIEEPKTSCPSSLPRPPSLRDLRFNSMIRLKSAVFSGIGLGIDEDSVSTVATSRSAMSSTSQATSDYFSGSCDELENAFHGIVTDDNTTQQMRQKEETEEITDFWADVQF